MAISTTPKSVVASLVNGACSSQFLRKASFPKRLETVEIETKNGNRYQHIHVDPLLNANVMRWSNQTYL
eukprot:5705915-Amphidinium_carterae.1